MEGEKRLRYFQERFLERKTEEVTAKHEKEDTEKEEKERQARYYHKNARNLEDLGFRREDG